MFSNWLKEKHGKRIITVKYKTEKGEEITLEEDVLRNNTIPSIAFGWKTCSQKFKVRPVDQWLKANATWVDGIKPTKYIGFEAGEERIEWRLGRKECKEKILQAGLRLPPKSSCFFCPNMKKHEVLKLPDDLKQRAIRMEENATKLIELKGLGRQYSWKDLITADQKQIKMFEDFDYHQIPCECID
jgi:hypothetical protein